MRRILIAASTALALFRPLGAGAGEIPKAIVVLEIFSEGLPGYVPEAAPPRFALLEGGDVFVGGTSRLAAGHLEGADLRALEKRLDQVRRQPGLKGSVTIGPGSLRHRLFLRKGRPIDMVVTGDPTQAPPELQPLASLLLDLPRFDHPSLRPYEPASFALSAREGRLAGGCRGWPFPDPPSTSAFAPRIVSAADARGWPTGAAPAAICVGDKSYVVTFRPLLPGEKP